MKLVESEIPDHPTGSAPKPNPPRRRVAVSLMLTVSVLTATVVIVYTVFPKRHNEVLSVAVEHHREPRAAELESPSRGELIAWSVGLHDKPVPFPQIPEGVQVDRAYALRIFKRPVALVRLVVSGQPVTLMAMQARDVPPRRRRSVDGDLLAQSWREGKWTFIAVGNQSSAKDWQAVVGAK